MFGRLAGYEDVNDAERLSRDPRCGPSSAVRVSIGRRRRAAGLYSARAFIEGVILEVATAERYEGRKNLATVRDLVAEGEPPSPSATARQGPDEEEPSGMEVVRAYMMESDVPAVRRAAARQASEAEAKAVTGREVQRRAAVKAGEFLLFSSSCWRRGSG